MRVAFFDLSFENLGVQTLSAVLERAGHEPVVVYEPMDHVNLSAETLGERMCRRLSEALAAQDPDVACFSAFTDTFRFHRAVAERFKALRPGTPVVFGGIHATLMGAALLEHSCIDYVVVGEGERPMLALLDEMAGERRFERVPNLCYRSDGRVESNPVGPYLRAGELEELPYPDKRPYFSRNPYLRKRYMIMTSRGCVFKCAYCCNNALKRIVYPHEKVHIRRRTPRHVVDELLYARETYGIESVFFLDDVFTCDRKWLAEFTDLYEQEIDLPSESITHPSFVSEEVADMLRRLRCTIVEIGVQTANEEYRKRVLGRKESNAEVERAIRALRRRGISVSLDHIFGLPGETLDDVFGSIRAYARWAPSNIAMHWLVYYPNTALVDEGLRTGDLTREDVDRINRGEGRINYAHFSAARNEREYLKASLLMYSLAVLPAWLVDFLARRPDLVPASPLLNRVLGLASSLKLQLRRKGTALAIALVIRNKLADLVPGRSAQPSEKAAP